MIVKTLDESIISDIGHAFGYYDYGTEGGLVSLYSSQEAASIYIQGYVRSMLKGGFLHTTSERGEGYIAYKLPGQKIGLKTALPLLKGIFQSMTIKEIFHFIKLAAKGGSGLDDQMNKAKKPHIYVGMVCVREAYQGQGYMRKVMDIAFAEGNRLQVPVVLDTDARSKCDKYMHLGMELAGKRNFGRHGFLYDLVKYPDDPAASLSV